MLNRRRIAIVSIATLAAVGAITGAASIAGSTRLATSFTPPPHGEQADKTTQVHMQITNNTAEQLILTASASAGAMNHWQNRPTDLAPGQTQTINNYAAADAQIDVTYKAATSGTVFTLEGVTPLIGTNSATGSSSNPSYTVAAHHGSGYNPTDTYSIEFGRNFGFTGHTETYTVPPGVTALGVDATGGTGGFLFQQKGFDHYPTGAHITGTLAVTPGDVLTVGVAGGGSNDVNNGLHGGWGMTNGSTDYAGGDGYNTTNGDVFGAGGATVVLDNDGNVVLVAGGGGATSNCSDNAGDGGRAGYQGSPTGENGGPDSQGGPAGANTVSHGQDADSGGAPGGGGVNGGLAGNSCNEGGGAGSSSTAGLTNPTVSNSPAAPDGESRRPQVTFGLAAK